MSQDFHGDVGQVAAGNIINKGRNTHLHLNIHGDNSGVITVEGQFSPRQTRLLPPIGSGRERTCPQCEEVTWRYNQLCMHCDYDLHRHDEMVAMENEEARRVRLQQKAILVFSLCVAVTFALVYFLSHLPDSLQQWAISCALVTGFFAFVALKTADNTKH